MLLFYSSLSLSLSYYIIKIPCTIFELLLKIVNNREAQ